MVSIRLDHVSATLGARTVVRRVTTRFDPGTLTGIIGPNGAGKSTLARAMLALLPIDGRVSLDDREVATIPPAERARMIAYLPQGQLVHWPLTVERLVALGRLPHLGPLSRIAPADAQAVERAMARAEILPLRDRIVTELSGGERARVLLARALAVEAPALVADEPLASLDPGHQIDVMELLRDEARGGGTVIAVLHDLTMAARYCDRLILLDRGQILAEGTPVQVLIPANLRTVYGVDAQVEWSDDHPAITLLGRSKG